MLNHAFAIAVPSRQVPIAVFALFGILCVENSVGRGDDLSQIRAAFDFMRSAKVSMRVQETRSSRLQAQPVILPYDVTCLRDGDRWGFQGIEPLRDQSGKSLRHNFYWRGDEGVQFNSICDSSRKQLLTDRRQPLLAAIMFSPSVSGTRDVFDSFWPTGNIDALCFGFLDGQPLCSAEGLLANAKIVGAADGLVIVEGNSRFGKLTLWCDPNKNFLPQRGEFVQSPDHYSRGRRIADIVMNGGNVWPAGRIKNIRRTIDMHFGQLESAPSRPYISGWKMIKKTDCEAGVVVTTTTQTKVTSIELDRAWEPRDFLFGLEIPKGQRVQVNGAEHLSYVWDGNWAVPEAAKLVPGTATMRGTGTLRRRLGIGAVVLLLVVACLWIMKYRKTRSA